MGRRDRTGKRTSRANCVGKRNPNLGYYYIVTDAEKTEKYYLEGLRDSIPEEFRNKIVIKVDNAPTKQLIKKCREELSIDAQYRKPWIIFDRDKVQNFDKIIEEAKNYGIEAGWSNPCFEIWLFAYFGEMPNIPDSKQCCKKFAEAYNKRTRQKYEKSEENIYGKMCDYGDEEKAFSVARQKRKQFDKDSINIPSEMVPCTRVDILVKEIKDKIKSN